MPQYAQSTLPHGTTLVERHYSSQQDIVRAVMGAHNATDDTWYSVRCSGPAGEGPMLPESRYETNWRLNRACKRFLGIFDDDCLEAMRTVDAIADKITRQLKPLPGLDVRRQRTRGRSGYAINPHAVLRGQLSTAWKRTERITQLKASGVITLILCVDADAGVTSYEAQCTAAATLALARKLEEHGRRVELWGSILTHHAHTMRQRSTGQSFLRPWAPQTFDEIDHCILKRAEDTLAGPAIAALCSIDFLRVVYFKIWELQYGRLGFLNNYGSATTKQSILAAMQPYLARQGIRPETVIGGADYSDYIDGIDTATAWVWQWLVTIAHGGE
jgi:hypothetical protein